MDGLTSNQTSGWINSCLDGCMTAMYQGQIGATPAVGEMSRGQLPKPIDAMSQGSQGPVMSDMQMMQNDERRQHEQNYIYEKGHNDGSATGWESSF